ncbi:hypothetical protein ENSA5_05640 [Enhygromyxa salina]|uniref:Uncharacterized protein n=1 Tax=Enhygromyxa salina TaxID=215803 RepID=A0A2S9YHZ0_9BACT|nr:hypothetical protein [Enhygromyxa salina]PRQ04690.1 hypothetical protein ENSA5_05640 [Enhygromyxa salina]
MSLSNMMLTTKDDELLGVANRADGMGVLAIWSVRARDLVPHLTEQTTQLRGFQVLCEALALWEGFEAEHSEFAGRVDDFFILIEQAFARTVVVRRGLDRRDAWPLPGARRVRGRFDDVPHISRTDRRWHLLGGQKANGVWGLYRGAAGRAGLLDAGLLRLSEPTREARRHAPGIEGRARKKLLTMVRAAMAGETVELPNRANNPVVRAIERCFEDVPLADHLHAHLVEGHALNRRLARRLRGRKSVSHRAFLETERRRASGEMALAIEQAIRCEDLLAVVESVFRWLCAHRGKRLDTIAPDLPVEPGALREALGRFADSGYYGTGIAARRHQLFCQIDPSSRVAVARSVLELHATISKSRGRAAWVWEEDGRLRSDLELEIPQDDLFVAGVAWRNDYYLEPLRAITNQLHEVRA